MVDATWGDARGSNDELWSEMFYVVAQWLCQLRAQSAPAPAQRHIVNPATDNDPCDWCCFEGFDMMQECFVKLLEVYGSVAYSCGASGVPEREAARRALQETVERAHQLESVKELLAQLPGKAWWWHSPLKDDERQRPRR